MRPPPISTTSTSSFADQMLMQQQAQQENCSPSSQPSQQLHSSLSSLSPTSATIPWQYYWKRPEYWETPEVLQPFSSDTAGRSSIVVVDHAAAAVANNNILEERDNDSNNSKTSQHHSMVEETAADPPRLYLTVTLVGLRSTNNLDSSCVADRVVLALTDATTQHTLQSRTLKWPNAEERADESGSGGIDSAIALPFAHREVISCAGGGAAAGPLLQTLGVLFNKPDLVVAGAAAAEEESFRSSMNANRNNNNANWANDTDGASHDVGDDETRSRPQQPTPRFHQRRRRKGLVAAALLRLADPSPTTAQHNALEVLNFLSLSVRPPFDSPQKGSSQQQPQKLNDASSGTLVLVLLTSTGQVHVYENPLGLLQDDAASHTDNTTINHNTMEDAMTHFVFGSDLVATLQSHILPLSQPSQSLQVTLPTITSTTGAWDPTMERNTVLFLEPGSGPWIAQTIVPLSNRSNIQGMAVITNNAFTGAVTLVRTSSWTEQRTLFLPSPVRKAQGVEWGGKLSLLVLVLEDDGVVAIALAAASLVAGPVTTSSSVAHNASSTEKLKSLGQPKEPSNAASPPTTSSGAAPLISIAKYQILLVQVPILSSHNDVSILQPNTDDENSNPCCVVSSQYQQSQYVWTAVDTTTVKPDAFFYYNAGNNPTTMVVIQTQLERQARLSSAQTAIVGKGYGVASTAEGLYYVGWEGQPNQKVHELASTPLAEHARLAVVTAPPDSVIVSAVDPTAETADDDTQLVHTALETIRGRSNKQPGQSLLDTARDLHVPLAANPYNCSLPAVSCVAQTGRLGWLSLRKAPSPAPLLSVVAWLLEERKDSWTAAVLTLQQLGALDSLQHEFSDESYFPEPSAAVMEGLYHDAASEQARSMVADYAVTSLIEGQYSYVLEEFLQRDKSYHPGQASLQLASASARVVEGSSTTSTDGADLWPIRCMLTVGKSREYLPTTLQLLNATLPRQLRDGSSVCTSLVSWIVSAGALELLLDVMDEEPPRRRYWNSLDPNTQRKLAVLQIQDAYPLLKDGEVRQWCLDEVSECLTAEKRSDSVQLLQSDWLESLIRACLHNAGCNTDLLQVTTERNDENDDVNITREGLLPSPGSGGLDFSMVIPALLVLEMRKWNLNHLHSTRNLLNASCYLAGRRNVEDSQYFLNTSLLMQQCTIANDVEAGANLIGGKSGLVLECCHVLMIRLGLSMEEAENYISSDYTELLVDDREAREAFSVSPSHQRLLRLLQEHVVSIRTYGEFETTHVRGRVDPVFAASLCLKTWWSISLDNLSEASTWITDWLEQALKLKDGQPSPYRLACAALARALLWPETKDGPDEDILASKLGIRTIFLIQLSESCCGLVESIPPYAAEHGCTPYSVQSKGTDLNESFVTASGGSFHES